MAAACADPYLPAAPVVWWDVVRDTAHRSHQTAIDGAANVNGRRGDAWRDPGC
jgi:hypothetical protein